MVANSGKSEIIEFYRNKNILITGASGFLGRLLVEKCLRQCDVKKLYILVRAKKGTSPKDRLQSLFQVPLFDELRAQRPDFMNKIELVEGDVSLPELGISPGVRSILVEKIQIVFHGAATVNFEEPLKRATAINVKGSRDMALLCKEMKHLQALVHVSTAFCHSPREEIREMFYDAPISADNLIKLTDCLSEDQLNKITKTLLAEWPNTYAFTKAVAEDAIKNYASDLPTCVFRPGVVISTLKDPIPGWIDNVYGPSGLIAGTGAGLLRVCRMDNDAKCDFVPADFCINAMMAAGYKTNLLGPDTEIPIFNFTTAKENPLTLREFHRMLKVIAHEIPPIQAVWYITMTGTKSAFWFSILSFLYHILPALIIDTVLFILQKKPQAMKIYRKIHKFSGVLAYFATRTWDFHTNNLQALRNGLNKTDQELFDFDMRSLDWGETIRANARGIRKYIMKEDESNVPAAKRRMFFLHALHRFVQLIIFGIFMWFSMSVLSPVIQSVVR